MKIFSGKLLCINILAKHNAEYSPCRVHYSDYIRIEQNVLNKYIIQSLGMHSSLILSDGKAKGRKTSI